MYHCICGAKYILKNKNSSARAGKFVVSQSSQSHCRMEFHSQFNKIAKLMHSNKTFHRGILFIYNVYFYQNGNHRKNSEKDVKALTETFYEMNADVVDLSDDTLYHIKKQQRALRTDGLSDSQRLIKKMNNIKEYDFKDYEYVAIAVLSHGKNNGIVMLYGEREELSLEETFLKPLIMNNSLRKKLKWIIAAPCKGKNRTYKPFSGNFDELPIQNHQFYFLTFSTTEGCTALRPSSGNLFIQKLCEKLKERKHEADGLTIFKEVAKLVETQSQKIKDSMQTASESNNLRGTFKFWKTPEDDKFFIDIVWK